MWPVSEAFRAAVRRSHTVVVTAEAWFDDARIATVYPVSGSVSVDSRRAVRRTVSLTFVDEDGTLVPPAGGTSGILTPYGGELRVYRGVRYDDGSEEIVPLGVFVITNVDVRDTSRGREIGVTGSDRSIRIARNRLVNPYQITGGTATETAIRELLVDRWADVDTDFPATGQTVGARVLAAGAETDPWAAAVEIAEAAGFDLAFDVDGVARMQPIPDPLEDDAVETYADGTDAVLLEVARAMDTGATYNGVIVSSEASDVDAPVRAEAWDEDPNSPTFRYGPFGEVPLFVVSSLIVDVDQAEEVARTQLLRQLGRTEAVEWSQVVNPAHDVLDVIRIVRPASKVDAVLLIDRLDVPLDATGTMSAVARVREV